MKHSIIRDVTICIIVAPQSNDCVQKLKDVLHLGFAAIASNGVDKLPVQDPFDIPFMLSNICCESSKEHIRRFRQSMFQQVQFVFLPLIQVECPNVHNLLA